MLAELALGIFAVVGWGQTPAPATYANPLIDGIVVQVRARDLEPRPSVVQWQQLDATFAAAARAHKRIHLVIAPGGDMMMLHSLAARRYASNGVLAMVTINPLGPRDPAALRKATAFFCTVYAPVTAILVIDPPPLERDDLRDAAAYGWKHFPSNFGLLDDGARDEFAVNLMTRFAGKIATGFQLHHPLSRAALRRVLARHPRFIEIDERDANDAALADAIRNARAAIFHP